MCEQHNNPADFFLDVISANESSVSDEGIHAMKNILMKGLTYLLSN